MNKYSLVFEYLKLESNNPIGCSRIAPLIKMINADQKIVEELLEENNFENKNNLLSFLDFGVCSLLKDNNSKNCYDPSLTYETIKYVLVCFRDLENKWSINGEDFIKYLKGGVENV